MKTFSNIQSNVSNNPNWPSQKRKLTNTRTKSKTEVVSPGKMFHPKAIIQRIENTNQIFKISASEQKQETPRSTNLTSNFKISNLANLQSFLRFQQRKDTARRKIFNQTSKITD